MDKRTKLKLKAFLLINVIFALAAFNCRAEAIGIAVMNGDSLTLREIISKAISTYPTVKSAEEAINNAEARINLARTGYYPEIDANANFSNLGPVTKLSIPNMGSFQLYPENNYSASVNYRQVLFDFGRTKQNIEYEKEGKSLGEQTLEQTRQRISMMAVGNFYTLLFLQSALKIKEEQLTALNEHLDHVSKMKETGSATEYQVLSTKVKISAVESQKVDLEAAIKVQQAQLNALTGADQNNHPVVKNEINAGMELVPEDSVFSYAMKHRDEMLMNQKRITMAGLRYDITKLQYKPVISLAASGGAKNGYVPELYQIKPNYVVGIGIRVPIFDGNRTKYNLVQAKSAITSLEYESDLIKRNISNEIVDAETYMRSAERKVGQCSLQLEQALKAYALALTSFNSGVITNLDLLDSNTSVSESRLQYLKAQIDYVASIYKFKAALGERIY
jgi:outer membrane protein TolC